MSCTSIRSRTVMCALFIALAGILFTAGSGRAQAQCVGDYTVTGVPFGTSPCSSITVTPAWQNGDCTTLTQTFSSNVNHLMAAICCMADPGAFLGYRVNGVLCPNNQTTVVKTDCGCLSVTVATTIFSRNITITWTPGPC